ncbi:hypothetical protein F511_17208 [Dorcoceras hygrometricum]|uniref:Uncharacterized protein n=1 Tax=Dorcoceras hygrometricum TaxID=472368 RepID=A0A2Z7AZI1_9LAMI|nr:hypothetical protein F511_17208 [Dorcoceras hygrometricum]
MVHEYKTLSHTFEEIKAENASLKNSSAESSSDELEDTDSLKTELSRLKIENDLLRNEASELKAEVDKLTKEMSSWNQSTRSLFKLSKMMRRRFIVATGSPAASEFRRYCLLLMMTAIHYGLKVNWSKVLFHVLKDMMDRSQRKAKGFAAQIGVLLKGIPTFTMGDGVPFPSAKILSMKTVHTYIVTNTTIDARAESEEPGMAKTVVEKKTPKAKKKTSSADEIPVDIFAEIAASKKRSATEADAPIITKKRRTGKSKPSVSQVNLDIVQVAPDVEPLQIIDPTHAVAAVPSPVLKRKSRKRRLVLSRGSDDESVGTKEIVKDADADAVASTDEATENSSAYVSATVGRHSTKKIVLLTSTSSHMFRGNSDACVSATVEILTIKTTVLLTSFHLIVFKGNRSACVSITDRGLYVVGGTWSMC